MIRFVVNENKRDLEDPTSYYSLIGYWRTKNHEVDFVINLHGKLIPIEVKYQEHISKQDLLGTVKGSTIPQTKEIIFSKKPEQMKTSNNYIILPVAIFLLLLYNRT